MNLRILKKLTAIALTLAMLTSPFSAFADTLALPSSVRVISEAAFEGDQQLDQVILPEGVEVIDSRAFANSSLNAVNLPDSLYYIADDAFDDTDSVDFTAEGSYAEQWVKMHQSVLSFVGGGCYDATLGIFDEDEGAGRFRDWFVAYYTLEDGEAFAEWCSGEPEWSMTQVEGPETYFEYWPVNHGLEAGINIAAPDSPCFCRYEVRCTWDGLEAVGSISARFDAIDSPPEAMSST